MKRFKILMRNIGYRPSNLVISLILLILFLIALLMSSSFLSTSLETKDFLINKTIDARLVSIRKQNPKAEITQEDLENLSSLDHIVAVFPQKARFYRTDLQFESNKNVSAVFVGANQALLPKISSGETIDLSQNQLLVPQVLHAEDGSTILGKDLIGQTLKLKVQEHDFSKPPDDETDQPQPAAIHEKEFEITGTYEGQMMTDYDNQFVASFDTVLGLNTLQLGNINEYQDTDPFYTLAVDRYENRNAVMTQLSQSGYYAEPLDTFDDTIINFLILITAIVAVLVSIISVVVLGMIQIRNISKRTVDIGLMKALGFRNGQIVTSMVFQTELISLVALIIAIIVTAATEKYLSTLLFNEFAQMNVFGPSLLIGLAVALLVPLLSSAISLKKILKISPTVAMKEVS